MSARVNLPAASVSQIEVSHLAPVTLLPLHPLPTHTLARGITLVVSRPQGIAPTLLALVTTLEPKEARETGVTLEPTPTTFAAAPATAITGHTQRSHRVAVTGYVRGGRMKWRGVQQHIYHTLETYVEYRSRE